jgi:hypothetical protein
MEDKVTKDKHHTVRCDYTFMERDMGKKSFIIMVTVLLYLFFNSTLMASTLYTWQAGSGNWFTATNWSPIGIPNSPDHIAFIPNTNQYVTVNLNGSATVGGLEIDEGNILTVPDAAALQFSQYSSGTTTVINNGTIELNSSGNPTLLQSNGDGTILTGTGKVTLGGDVNNILSGSSITNDVNHTIEGGGTISCLLGNLGKVVANNGILKITTGVANDIGSVGYLSAMGKDNELHLQCNVTGGKLQPNDGKIVLEGGAALYGISIEDGLVEVGDGNAAFMANVTLSSKTELNVLDGYGLACIMGALVNNDGIIKLNSSGNNTSMVCESGITVTGAGRIILGGNSNNVLGGEGFAIGKDQTVEGGGGILASFENQGNIMANNGVLTIWGSITGNGNIHVFDNATLELNSDLQTGNFSMDRLAALKVTEFKTIELKQNFLFRQVDESKWIGGDTIVLLMTGAGSSPQSLEVGGRDYGAVAEGFYNNFSLGGLDTFGEKTYVFLSDAIDNGHRSPPEALYVHLINIFPGSTLNLNGIHLYTYFDGIHRVMAGEGDMFGGGKIIDKPQKPISLPFLNLLLFDQEGSF